MDQITEQNLANEMFLKELVNFNNEDKELLCLSKQYCLNQLVLYKIRKNNIYVNLSSCLSDIKLLAGI